MQLSSIFEDTNVWDAVSAIVLILTAALVWQQLRLQARNHVLSSLELLISRWDSDSMVEARRHVAESWLSGRYAFDGNAQNVCDFLQQLGAYYKLGAFPKQVIWDSFSFHLEYYYEVFKADLQQFRSDTNDPTLYRNFEEIVEAMARHSQRKGAPSSSQFNVKRFLENELEFCLRSRL